jgi:hypothetical protein
MKRNKKFLFVGLLAMLMIAFLAGPVISADSETIVGIVNDSYQIVTDNDQVYEIAESEKGDELIELVDKKVKVKGTVEEDDGAKLMTVTSYEVIEE